jgi:hypothetical protein
MFANIGMFAAEYIFSSAVSLIAIERFWRLHELHKH